MPTRFCSAQEDLSAVMGVGVSDNMANFAKSAIGQKVRWFPIRLSGAGVAACSIVGMALFYAWNLYAIYYGPLVSTQGYMSTTLGTIVTSISATLGFVVIGAWLYRLRHFEIIGMAISAATVVFVPLAVVLRDSGMLNPTAAQLLIDVVSRICSCWVIVSWGAQYSRFKPRFITIFALASFLIALVVCFSLNACPIAVKVTFASITLPLSMVFALLVKGSKGEAFAPNAPGPSNETFVGLTWRIIVVFFLFGIVTWVGITLAQTDFDKTRSLADLSIVGSGTIVVIFLLIALFTKGTFSTSFIYRVALPLVMTGMMLVTIPSVETPVGTALIAMSYTCFDLFCFTLFANACRKTGTDPRKAFGWCRAIESSAPIPAIALITMTSNLFPPESHLLSTLIVAASVLVAAALMLFSSTKIFEKVQSPQTEEKGLGFTEDMMQFALQFSKAVQSAALSPREAEILSLIVRGRSVPYIAEKLAISRSTVKTHIAHIYEKLDVADRQEMIDAIEAIPLDEGNEIAS